jgi:hypothetical protein
MDKEYSSRISRNWFLSSSSDFTIERALICPSGLLPPVPAREPEHGIQSFPCSVLDLVFYPSVNNLL